MPSVRQALFLAYLGLCGFLLLFFTVIAST
jgi:hypothetical protein